MVGKITITRVELSNMKVKGRVQSSRVLSRAAVSSKSQAAILREPSASARKKFQIRQLDADDISLNSRKWYSLTRLLRCCGLVETVNPTKFEPEQLEENMIKLHRLCLIPLQDSYKLHLNRTKGVKLIEYIVPRTEYNTLEQDQVIRLVWSGISCIHHFHIRLRGISGVLEWSRRRQAKRAVRSYELILSLVMPGFFTVVLQAVTTFFQEGQIWDVEYLCAEILWRLMDTDDHAQLMLSDLLDLIEKTTRTDMQMARQITCVLYGLLENRPWEKFDVSIMRRLLHMFNKSIQPSEKDEYNYAPLCRGLEICIRYIFENVQNDDLMKCIKVMLAWPTQEMITNEALLDFGNLLEYAAILHLTQSYRESITSEIFGLLMGLIASDNLLHSLLGNRVLQQLFDRHNNRLQFDTPRIFYKDTHFNVEVAAYSSSDKSFIRNNREVLHGALLASVQQHGMHRLHLENVYSTIAIIIVEVPCGYTAAAMVCLAMAIQEFALADDTFQLEEAHRLHATVVSIISLICWVHNAEVFYEYINTLIAKRAQFAPHLNPPLRPSYQYAQHHILWNKPELFFEDWEVRYGLWKCFRSRLSRRNLSDIDIKEEDLFHQVHQPPHQLQMTHHAPVIVGH